MKSILHPLLAALFFSGGFAFAEQPVKVDSGSGVTHIEVGPVAVSVAVSGNEGEKGSKTAFLGIVTASLAPQLRAQLNLPEGMGLSVEAVAKDSPADKAGIKKYDVLKKFNDQMLCAQEQLAVLVKAAGKGNLSLIHISEPTRPY